MSRVAALSSSCTAGLPLPLLWSLASRWYAAQSAYAWGPERPSLQETRTHAKCLRSVSSVRDYFREYRAKKKHVSMGMGQTDQQRGPQCSSVSRTSFQTDSGANQALLLPGPGSMFDQQYTHV